MADGLFSGLSRQQLTALGEIAIGEDGGHHPRTLESLERLIIGYEQVERTMLGPLTYRRYYMPIHVHIRWCEYCSDQYSGECR